MLKFLLCPVPHPSPWGMLSKWMKWSLPQRAQSLVGRNDVGVRKQLENDVRCCVTTRAGEQMYVLLSQKERVIVEWGTREGLDEVLR